MKTNCANCGEPADEHYTIEAGPGDIVDACPGQLEDITTFEAQEERTFEDED